MIVTTHGVSRLLGTRHSLRSKQRPLSVPSSVIGVGAFPKESSRPVSPVMVQGDLISNGFPPASIVSRFFRHHDLEHGIPAVL